MKTQSQSEFPGELNTNFLKRGFILPVENEETDLSLCFIRIYALEDL